MVTLIEFIIYNRLRYFLNLFKYTFLGWLAEGKSLGDSNKVESAECVRREAKILIF